jgi:hypothetical protein
MKSFIQIVATLVILAGVVFGATFFTQYTRTKEGGKDNGQQPPRVQIVRLSDEKEAVWDPEDRQYVQEFERGTKGHYDFVVANPNDKPITVHLDSTTCKCTNVEFAMVSAATREKLKEMKPLPAGRKLELLLDGVKWATMLKEKSQPTIPMTIPAADGGVPQFAAVRMEWDTKDPQTTRLTAKFNARLGADADFWSFEVPVVIVPPVMVAPQDGLSVGELFADGVREASIYVWSATRKDFEAKVELSQRDPCITVAPPRALAAEELKTLSTRLAEAGIATHKSRPICGYEIKVTVAEKRGDNQLELGPLGRRIVVNRGQESELFVILSGTVRGPIQVGEQSDRDRIDLRVFRADRGTDKTVSITTTDPNLQMSVDHVTPEGVQVDLQEEKAQGGPRSWSLKVVVPPNVQAGPFPTDSAIYLKLNTNPPRRIRIPLVGNASG